MAPAWLLRGVKPPLGAPAGVMDRAAGVPSCVVCDAAMVSPGAPPAPSLSLTSSSCEQNSTVTVSQLIMSGTDLTKQMSSQVLRRDTPQHNSRRWLALCASVPHMNCLRGVLMLVHTVSDIRNMRERLFRTRLKACQCT